MDYTESIFPYDSRYFNVKISRMLKVSEAVTDIISGYLPKYPPYELASVSPSKTKLYDYTKKKG